MRSRRENPLSSDIRARTYLDVESKASVLVRFHFDQHEVVVRDRAVLYREEKATPDQQLQPAMATIYSTYFAARLFVIEYVFTQRMLFDRYYKSGKI